MRNKYLPELDGIRALAVLCVMISHFFAGQYNPNKYFHFGRVGVIVFFVLSGYLITGLLLQYRDLAAGNLNQKWRNFGSFYARRVLRIFPIYYLTIFIAAAVAFDSIRSNLGWHLAYLSNMGWALGVVNLNQAAHLWSLCVEEQFYLIWPLVVFFAPSRYLKLLTLSVIVLGISYKILASTLGWGWIITNFTLFGCFDSLGVGALIAIAGHENSEISKTRLIKWSFVMGILALAVLQYARVVSDADVRQRSFYAGWIDVAIVFSFLPLLIAVIKQSAWPGMRFLCWKPLRYLGKISYGVYLYHFFLLALMPWASAKLGWTLPDPGLLRFALYSSITIAMAAISWSAIERPLNGLKRHFIPRAPSAT